MDNRTLRNRISHATDNVPLALRLDNQTAVVGVNYLGHRQQRHQCVALRPSVRRDVGFPIGDADREVQRPFERRFWQTWAVVDYRDSGRIGHDFDTWCDVSLFARV